MTRSLRPLLRAVLFAGACAAPGLAQAQPMLAGAPVRDPALRARYAPPTDVGPPEARPLSFSAPLQTVRVNTGAGAVRQLSIPRGRSATVELPVDARDVMVSNPSVADVALSTPRRIYVLGTHSGQTDATFVDGTGRQILRLDIRVDQDSSALQQTLSRLLPDSSIKVEAANDSLVLSGEAVSAAEADKAMRLAAAYASDPRQVINMIAVSGSEQVMLQVKIVEVNRTVIKQLGFNLGAITGQLGMPQYSFFNSPTYGVNGAYLGGAAGGYAVNTTSQPVSGYAGLASIPGLSQAAGLLSGASAVGIPIAAVGQFISTFLTGSGAQSLTTAQSSYLQNYVAGSLSSFSTQITPNTLVNGVSTAGSPFTATASLEGITSSNITQYENAFLNGGTVNGAALNNDQRLFLQAFNSNIAQSYNPTAQNSLQAAQQSLFRDRSNPANYVQTNTAGSTGLNQANALVQAFERVGLVRTLAEPTLTAISGESARFLAGGEFPVPVGQDNNGRVTVEFKQFGVGLGFTPVVLSHGRISLKISTEVSELTNIGAFTLSNSNGTNTSAPSLSIPGLNVRKAETVVELPSGGAMAIAGLMRSQTQETLDSLPGLGQLPVVGALLRSRDFQQNESELVVIVTPYLVKPVRPDQLSTPADGLQIADDLQTNLLGRINAGFNKKPAAPATAATPSQSYQGPFGYVVD